MLKYSTIRILFAAAFCGSLVFHFMNGPVAWWVWMMMGVCFAAVLAWGATDISLSFFTPVHNRAVTTEKQVAISFDDGPARSHTPEILDILKEHQVPGAFFCIGERAAQEPGLLQRIHAEGHVIGNHSYSHAFWFDMYGAAKMLEELRMADAAIAAAISHQPKLFRPPYGVTNPNLAKAIRSGGYSTIGWSIRSLDTVAKDTQLLLQRVLKNVRPGDIFLFHDTCRITVQILPELIETLRQRGFSIVRVDKLLNVKAYA
ncbi:polysaccharide deacetylase family protein [Chitinophaga sedimenti]|uniref:polysaccharide deacetylase family protein n=1 Tax=Chitinophaga sedimenti TaxID=2033606 RepID=UPI0020057A6C|nr:polysaccharide deacetylase family protein [Chitinophaga sedimenti]MCK7560117.1 polysaccharide deacetylase family protein [Chitinophaga sedimenti]